MTRALQVSRDPEVRLEFVELDYAELGGNVATTLLPFRPSGRLVEWALRTS